MMTGKILLKVTYASYDFLPQYNRNNIRTVLEAHPTSNQISIGGCLIWT